MNNPIKQSIQKAFNDHFAVEDDSKEPELDTNKYLFVETATLNRKENKKCLE